MCKIETLHKAREIYGIKWIKNIIERRILEEWGEEEVKTSFTFYQLIKENTVDRILRVLETKDV